MAKGSNFGHRLRELKMGFPITKNRIGVYLTSVSLGELSSLNTFLIDACSCFHYRGGLELLCDSKKIHNVNVENQNGEDKLTMKDLLSWVRTNLIKERPEMFMKGDTVRPGVLVLVNDCDWELSGQLNTSLEEKDVVVFISTLHGG
ncbi:hypothetical protein Ahy_A02g006125 isoform A [Arachis hypogaea]|uniref:Ubiquitin-related modifier 1 homolog n=1 Tax=Arachis hypogaea TaxID=3818 RepID=A0A445E9C6_ARAHY|nr:hypothetical protein Ahy_A02g006125 isoform A [Arachis hypogaea]